MRDPLAVVTDEDAEFAKLFAKTAEFKRSDKKFGGYASFNMRAVERGEIVVRRLREEGPLEALDALDVGAGSGGLSIALAKAGANVSAIEPDPLRLRWAEVRIRGHGADVRLTAGAAEQLAFPDASFDLVTLDSVIEHVADPDRVIREVARVLRPAGRVYMVSPNKSSVMNILRDPHYEMLGVVLMPRWLGRFYVERVRLVRRGYWVNVIPSKRWLARRFRAEGVLLEQLDPEGFEKLHTPGLVRNTVVRRVATAAKALGLTSLVRRILLAQYPVFVLLGRKARS